MQINQELLMISMRSLWQEVQIQIPNISFEDNFFEISFVQFCPICNFRNGRPNFFKFDTQLHNWKR